MAQRDERFEERYEIDGITYSSLDDVPQPYRDTIAGLMVDRDGDGVPDVFDRPSGSRTVVHHSESYEVDGVTYSSIDELPEPYRDSIAGLMVDRDGDGVPDVFDRPGSHTVVHHSESYEVDGVTYESLDEIPEPHRSTVRRALADADSTDRSVASALPSPIAAGPATPAFPAADAIAVPPSPIVTRAGWSTRTKLFAGMIAVDVAIAAVVLWLVLR